MENIRVDMRQYDCPFIDTTDDHDVSFFTHQWDFDAASRQLETRIMADGADRGALTNGLDALREHPNMHEYTLLSRQDDRAMLRTNIAETNAMHVVRQNEGFITGPFRIRDGSEYWHLGFDREGRANAALSELERENDFSLESRDSIGLDDYHDVMQNLDVAANFLDTCHGLSTVERRTLQRAVENDYFENPRQATLQDLATSFEISDTAVSKNLRRAERKVFSSVVGALNDVDTDGPV
ncbi:helix-turn-helix domain-containing protein [Haloarchaeobius sp. HRN-SO-5]|uniref:helix-turn-helix domain-containing protein n=1 Tax=Haloarchaeobius sp. HRN-SO-5 TaxID=3446118 RepID=UPI003EC0CBE5